jgi:hypothetical protein
VTVAPQAQLPARSAMLIIRHGHAKMGQLQCAFEQCTLLCVGKGHDLKPSADTEFTLQITSKPLTCFSSTLTDFFRRWLSSRTWLMLDGLALGHMVSRMHSSWRCTIVTSSSADFAWRRACSKSAWRLCKGFLDTQCTFPVNENDSLINNEHTVKQLSSKTNNHAANLRASLTS